MKSRTCSRWPRLALFLFFGLLLACHTAPKPRIQLFQGTTMGTFFQVKVVTNHEIQTALVDQGIREEMELVNSLMSNWKEQSEVSRFNRLPVQEWMTISTHTATVVARAIEIAAISKGRFDPTVSPLVELWGFGTRKNEELPSAAEIQAAKDLVGYDKIELQHDKIRKLREGLSLNLSALAKGYAADLVCAYLDQQGFSDYMVNIGGDGRVKGTNLEGRPWRMAIEAPDSTTIGAIYKVTELQDVGMATSGDYRNFFEHQGVAYSHLIDPTTGWPIPASITSVTIIAQDGMTADALATALSVMPPKQGQELIATMPGVECLLIFRDGENNLTELKSPGMDAYLAKD